MEHKKSFTVGVDLSGGKLKACVFKDDHPEFVDLLKEEINLYGSDKAQITERLGALLDELFGRVGITAADCDAIGVACPGNPGGAVVVGETRNNFTFVKEFLEQRYRLPVYLENDVDMGALGEHAFGAGQGADNMVLLFLGNSVGAGMMVDGKLYRGGQRQAGEVGQMIIDEHGAADWYQCPICKNRGCADSMASETAIVVLTKDVLRKGGQVGTYTFEDVAGVRADAVIAAAEGGDKAALEIVTRVARNISVVIYNVIITLDPNVLVVGGRLSRHFAFLFPLIEAELTKRQLKLANAEAKIVPSQIPGDIGLLGVLVAKK